MKLPNGLEIVSLEQRICQARLKAPFGAGDILAAEKLSEKLKTVSQRSNQTGGGDNFNFENIGDVLPRDADYIFVNFRALSKTIVPGHWIDWSEGDVLKNSVPKLLGATVYPNHDFTDVNNWLGSVQNAVWDEAGAAAEGVPGINATYKIDALMNPRIARGLLMTPPAIHSTSMTVVFKFEFSHPDVANESRWRFMELLGEEVEGEIVRLIVTEILEYWEASLVFQGADRLAKKYEDEDDENFENMSAANLTQPANSNEEKTMKLTNEQKMRLGIEFDGDDVPETEILRVAELLAAKNNNFDSVKIAELESRSAQLETLLTAKRAEVARLAKLAELGADEGALDEIISQQIADADAEKLVKLETYYQKKSAAKFPQSGRSSQENTEAAQTAGGVNQQPNTPVPAIGLH